MITILRNPAVTDKLLFELKEDDVLRGSITAVIDGGEITITDLQSEVELYYDGLCRAVLAYACVRGIDRAVFEITDERKLKRLKGFGFVSEGSKVLDSIQQFFNEDSCG